MQRGPEARRPLRRERVQVAWRLVVVATLRSVALQRYNPLVATLQVVWRRRDTWCLFVCVCVCFAQRDVEGSHLGGPVRAPTPARVEGYSRVLTGTQGTQQSTHRYVKPADSDAEMPILLCKLRKVPALHIA
jgi:hypothetical protein